MSSVLQAIDTGKIKDLQSRQHFDAIVLRGEVPAVAAGGSLTAKFNLASYGDFLSQDVTGSYSTLVDDGAGAAVDDGVCHLAGRLYDGQGGTPLFSDMVPLNLWLTPGRRRTTGVLLDAAGGVPNIGSVLFFPKNLVHLFPASNDIVLEVRNDSDWKNSFEIVFWGIRVKSFISTKGITEYAPKNLNQ
jgi:hypothetical protein